MSGSINVPFITPIIGITLGTTTAIYFDNPPIYCLGEILSFRVGEGWGTTEINEQQATVLEIGPNFVVVNIDSSNYTPFSIPVLSEEITNILVDTPAPGSTRIEFLSNSYPDASNIIFYNIVGTISSIINGFLFQVNNSLPNSVDINLNSSGYTYVSGGVTTAFPLTIAQNPPYAVPVGSGIIPDSDPSTVTLQCAFDRVRT